MMNGTGRSNAAKSSDSFLKTTTWGCLIALSILSAAFGFRGSFSSSDSGSKEQTEARLESPPLRSAQGPVPSPQSAYSGKQSRQSMPAFDQRRANRVSSVNHQVVPTTSPFSSMTPKSDLPNQSLDAASASDNQDPQTLIAAKIAPDLKGIDPEKPVDVIVQFRHSPSETELDADGAVTKVELPLLKARLVTMKGADVANLAMRANIAYVSPDRKVTG